MENIQLMTCDRWLSICFCRRTEFIQGNSKKYVDKKFWNGKMWKLFQELDISSGLLFHLNIFGRVITGDELGYSSMTQ